MSISRRTAALLAVALFAANLAIGHSAGASPTSTTTDSVSSISEAITYYFHSGTGLQTVDKLGSSHTFDTNEPVFTEPALATDVPIVGNGGSGAVWDPSWVGSVSGTIQELTVDFWAKVPEEEIQTGGVTWRVSLWDGDTQVVLPNAEMKGLNLTGPTRFTHTYTTRLSNPADQASQVPLSVTPSGTLGIQIRPWFVNGVGATIFYDAVDFPSGFSIVTGEGTTPTPTPTSDPTESPTESPEPERGVYPVEPGDEYFAQQWGPSIIRAPEAWQEAQATGFGIKVGVIDTGLDLGHPDLSCPGKTAEGAAIIDGQVLRGPKANDINGHGTHVAGIIGACTDNDEGVAGVAPDSTIIPYRVFTTSEEGSGDINDIAVAIRLAADDGVHVINMSLSIGIGAAPFVGGAIGYVPELLPEIDAAIEYAQSQGVVVVAAAGNSIVLPLCEYPSYYEDVVCVGATDSNDLKSWYGTFPNKPDENGVVGPALSAPGGQGTFCSESVLSTWWREAPDEPFCSNDPAYEAIDGTSMASPHVVGVAALAYDRLSGTRSAENATTIIDALLDGAEDLGTPGYDPLFGFGRVDALATVQQIPVAEEPTAASTTVAFTADSAEAGHYSDDAEIAARLLDDAGSPIAGAELEFELTNGDVTDKWTGTTDGDGVAAATRILDSDPGAYNLTVRYAGEDNVYESSADQTAFVIERELTVIELVVEQRGPGRTLTATLTEDDGPPLPGQEIVFYADGSEIGRATTDGDGVATLEAPPRRRGRPAAFEAAFEGTDLYEGSSGSSRP